MPKTISISEPIHSTVTTSSRNGLLYKNTPSSPLENEYLIQKAIHLLGLSSLDKKRKEKITKFIKETYSTCHCVVLCQKIGNNRTFFENLGVDIGKKEVMISESQSLFYTENYSQPLIEMGY